MRPFPLAALFALAACGPGAPPPNDAAVLDTSPPTDAQTTDANDGGVRAPTTTRGFATLAEYGLFIGNGATQQPAPGVIPYDVNAPLFSDFTLKRRFLYVPPGQRVGFEPDGTWRLPPGTILVKTFSYPRDERDPALGDVLIETRLLIKLESGYFAETYRWNDAQTEATRLLAGADVDARWIDRTGVERTNLYRVPNRVECERCHGTLDPTSENPMNALGLRTGQMNRARDYGTGLVNQIEHLASLGLFITPPGAASALERFEEPEGTGPLEARTRAYLHANCAHCHRPGVPAGFSGLRLNIEATDPLELGVCKIPSSLDDSGGRSFDVVPGHPECSILNYRMEISSSSGMMPPLGRNLTDPVGIALVTEWIRLMPENLCGQPDATCLQP